MYSQRITRESGPLGASVMNFASGASLNILAGAVLSIAGALNFSGDLNQSAGSQIHAAGTLDSYQAGASWTVNLTGDQSGQARMGDGTRYIQFSVGRNVPTHSASPGAIHYRSDGSMSNVYQNISDGAAGSVWRLNGAASG